MMGVISDIHGNLEALEATLVAGLELGVDEWTCLGDVVGYGANPNECAELVSHVCSVVLLGNHDEAAISDDDLSWFNPWAAHAVAWTRHALNPRWRDYLGERPFRHETPSATFVHSTPIAPEKWGYIMDQADAESQRGGFSTPLCFVGHSHRPGIYELPPDADVGYPRWIVNVGSVGQPRDGNPRACMVLFAEREDGPAQVEFIRVGYNIAKAQQKILLAGLPEMLAQRLGVGM